MPNRRQWKIDDQNFEGVVTRVLRKRDIDEPYGLMVDILFPAFAPKSLLPESLRGDLDSLIGKSVKCSLVEIDQERRAVILKIESVVEP